MNLSEELYYHYVIVLGLCPSPVADKNSVLFSFFKRNVKNTNLSNNDWPLYGQRMVMLTTNIIERYVSGKRIDMGAWLKSAELLRFTGRLDKLKVTIISWGCCLFMELKN
jgi:hypothetical protein